MKTIGILGIGPQATADLEARILEEARRVLPPDGPCGYPPMVVYHHRRPPVAFADGAPVVPFQADPELLDAARWLATRADFLILAANTPHVLASEIEEAAGCRLLSMIEATLAEVERRRWKRVGVLGFFDPDVPVYTRPLGQRNIHCETIDEKRQPALNTGILHVMEGRETESDRAAARAAVAALRERNVDGIILGCTEIPLLLGAQATAPDLLDPLVPFATRIVEHSTEE